MDISVNVVLRWSTLFLDLNLRIFHAVKVIDSDPIHYLQMVPKILLL